MPAAKRKHKECTNIGPKRRKVVIDLTNDEAGAVPVIQRAKSHTFFKKALPRSENVETAFMAMIKQFVAATEDTLTPDIMSHMILTMAKDESLQKEYYLSLRISLCETASALGMDDVAENFLKELRLAHQKTLFDSDLYRVPPELRHLYLFADMYEHIDLELTNAVCDKLRSFVTYGKYLDDFYSDFISELNITSKQYLQLMLAKSAYLIGRGFLNNTIPAPEIDTHAVANIFMNFAIEFQDPNAIKWEEQQKSLLPKP